VNLRAWGLCGLWEESFPLRRLVPHFSHNPHEPVTISTASSGQCLDAGSNRRRPRLAAFDANMSDRPQMGILSFAHREE
jgi:hypothetical protein